MKNKFFETRESEFLYPGAVSIRKEVTGYRHSQQDLYSNQVVFKEPYIWTAVFCPYRIKNKNQDHATLQFSDCCTLIGDTMSGIIDSYIPVAIFLAVGLIMPPMTMFMVKQLSPRSKAASKYTTYESGSIPTGTARIQFNVEYYLYKQKI